MPRTISIAPLLVGLGGLLAAVSTAAAQSDGDTLVDPRNIGRAGASVVSGDSGVALINNPAGMVRRAQSRVLISFGVGDSDLDFTATDAANSPVITNGFGATSIPTLAYHHGSADGRWVVGALLWGGSSGSLLPKPAFGQPAEDVERLFPHRYGGTNYQSTWRQLALGGAIRIGDSLGLGASIAVQDLEVSEERRIWAGFAGRDPLLGANRDLQLTLSGRDYFVPSSTLGLLYAPLELPLEFAVSTELRMGAELSGNAPSLEATNASQFPAVATDSPTASLKHSDTATLRAGVRYLGSRTFVEAGVDLVLVRNQGTSNWATTGLNVVDDSSATASLEEVPALRSERTHVTVRGAVDYEVLTGFLWLTGGYSWHSPSTAENLRMPAYTRLGGHRLAFGMLTAHEDYTLSLGYSRRLGRTRDIDAASTAADVINPFDAGTGPSNAGRYRSSSDQLGFSLEIAW